MVPRMKNIRSEGSYLLWVRSNGQIEFRPYRSKPTLDPPPIFHERDRISPYGPHHHTTIDNAHQWVSFSGIDKCAVPCTFLHHLSAPPAEIAPCA